MMSSWPGSLENPNFLRLWIAHSLSQTGSQITVVALPLAAAIDLQATAREMGVLTALETTPFILLSLFAGVWVDHVRRRPLLVACDLGRALLLASIPAAGLAGWLSLEQLLAVAFLAGCGAVLFDIAAQSYLPTVVDVSEIVDSNGKLELSKSLTQIAGPGLGGLLVRAIGAPLAITADALSFVASGWLLRSIRAEEPQPTGSTQRAKLGPMIRAGFSEVLRRPELRAIVCCTATSNFFTNMGVAVFILYVVRTLELSAAWLGAILAAGSIGAVLGAALVGRITVLLGIGPVLIASTVLMAIGALLTPVASPALPLWLVVAVLVLGRTIESLGSVIYNINQRSYRQVIIPSHLLGRVNATVRFVIWGVLPFGALVGGALGEAIGLRATLWLSGLGALIAPLWLLRSDIVHLRMLPS